jgi:hypothetical protein
MVVIRIPKKIVFVVPLLLALIAVAFLGKKYTPLDPDGRPFILSPSVWKMEGYKRKVEGWLREMEKMEKGMKEVIEEGENVDPGFLYRASEKVTMLISDAQKLAEDVTYTQPPLPFASFHSSLSELTALYLEAAKGIANWLSAPNPDNRVKALESLKEAETLRKKLSAPKTSSGT